MFKLEVIGGKALGKLAPLTAKLAKHSPEIMVGGGIVLLVTGTVLACKATLDAKEAVEEAVPDISGAETPEEKTVECAKLGIEIATMYAPAALAIFSGIGLVVSGHNRLRSRLLAMGAAYKTLESAYDRYRSHVIEEHGEETDRRYRLGTRKPKKKEGDLPVVESEHSDGFGYSMYARYFDQFNSNEHVKNQAQNYDFLLLKQSWANERLQRRGFLFLNEVYEELGFDYVPEGWLVGWKLGNGDNFVDFGLFEARNSLACDAVRYNGCETCFVLDFNVDGPIWDII